MAYLFTEVFRVVVLCCKQDKQLKIVSGISGKLNKFSPLTQLSLSESVNSHYNEP